MKPLILALLILAAIPRPALAAPAALDDLVRQALAQHPALQRAREAARAQEARVGVVAAPYMPQVSLSAGLNRTTNISNAQTATDPFNLGASSLGVRQQLFDFGKTQAGVEAAEANHRASEHQRDQQLVEVAFGVRRAYVEWVRAGGLEAQARAQLQAAQRLWDQAQAFYRAGRRPKLDVTRAEATYRQAESDMIAAQVAVEVAARALSAAMGQPGAVDAAPAFPAVPAIADAPMTALVERAADRHPALAVAAAQLESAEAGQKGAERARWPDLVGNANFGLRSRDVALNLNWLAGVSLDMPVFAGFALTRQQEAASAQAGAARAEANNQALQVRLAVERAAIALAGARRRLPAAEAALGSAEESLALAEGRYKAGVGTVIEVSDAQALRATAQASLVRAEAEIHLAVAELLRAVGMTGVEA